MPNSRFVLRLAAATTTLILLAGCSPAAKAPTADSAFDAQRAFGFLKKQVSVGTRVPDTGPHTACAAFIQDNLKPYADEVATQTFTANVSGRQLPLTNIIARFNPHANRWILLAAHWDTRPTADCEVVAEKRQLPIPGANDGASGTAVLLELARMFGTRKPDVGVIMVFFDGEDYGPGEKEMFLGAKHFASEAAKGRSMPPRERIAFGILLDMVGDKNLKITREQKSLGAAPDVMRNIWVTAEALGYHEVFPSAEGLAISDDHVPLIGAGIKCVDLIDFEYGPWHTLDDTPDKCSPRSLKTVGDVVAAVVYKESDK